MPRRASNSPKRRPQLNFNDACSVAPLQRKEASAQKLGKSRKKSANKKRVTIDAGANADDDGGSEVRAGQMLEAPLTRSALYCSVLGV